MVSTADSSTASTHGSPGRPGASGPWAGLALAGAAALIGLAVSSVWPVLSVLLVAVVLGVVAANTGWVPTAAQPGLAIASKHLLRAGIVLLGLQLSLLDIAGLGPGMLVVVVAVVVGGFAVAEVAGRALGVRPAQRTLIGAGFSICGAAAVAGVEGLVDDRRDEDVVTAVALVVLFGSLMIPGVPLLAAALGLDEQTAGLWAGASIHEVAQVVAAGGIIGGAALKAAVVVKLARVLMLAPVTLVLGWRQRRRGDGTVDQQRPPLVPLFVVGFLAASLVRTTGVLPEVALDAARIAQTLLLSAAMFALGCGVRFATLRTVGARPFLLATVTTLGVAGIGLGGVLLAG